LSDAVNELNDLHPWKDIENARGNLSVFDFPSTLMSIVGSLIRKEVTQKYIENAGLSFVEWKILSVLTGGRIYSFQEVEHLASTDKSLVSKTLRMLEGKQLITIKDRGNKGKKQLTCMITESGELLNSKTMQEAQSSQLSLLSQLTDEERLHMFNALQKWHIHFTGAPLPNPRNTQAADD
jgi:DNA-binding MarR family transcriptional regulator